LFGFINCKTFGGDRELEINTPCSMKEVIDEDEKKVEYMEKRIRKQTHHIHSIG